MKLKNILLLILGYLAVILPGNVFASAVGKQSPDFSLTDTQNNVVSLSDIKEKPLLLLFADESEESGKKLSQISAIYDYYSVSNLKIFTIAAGKTSEEASKYQEDLWLTYSLNSDPENGLAKLFEVDKFPKIVILDSKHVVRFAGEYTTDDNLRNEISKWTNEKVFVITARQFMYEPNIITVNKGDNVLIKLLAEDVSHGLFIDGYEQFVKRYLDRDGNVVAEKDTDQHIKPGEMGILRFAANKTGRFSMRCASTCSAYHPYMIGYLLVKPNYRYCAAIALSIILGVFSILFFFKEKNANRFLGIFPCGWRYELTRFSIVRSILKNRWVPLIAIVINIFFFTVILVACFVGGISAGNYNFGIMMVWIVWYVLLMMVMVPLFSRIWCGVCPLPFLGDFFQRGSFTQIRQKLNGLGIKWPKALKNMWLVNFLFVGTTFANGFLTTRPIASFTLFAVIILLATFISIMFERRTFCLYVCPVGGFQGLYSQIATVEIRSKDKEICKQHKLKTCFLGNENGHGCPWFLTPFNFKKNTYCGMCLECFKTCPHDNMALNLRSPGADLIEVEKRGLDEAWKAFIMIGCAIVFYVFMMGPWGALKDWQNAKTAIGFIKYVVSHSVFTLLLLPASFGIFVWLSRKLSRANDISFKQMFINYSYSLVPLGLMVWVAFSLGFLLPNGSYVLAVISDPFAWGWNLFGTKVPWTPVLTYWMPFLQIFSLLFGLVFSIDIASKISKQTVLSSKEAAIRSCIPIAAYITILTIALLWLFIGI